MNRRTFIGGGIAFAFGGSAVEYAEAANNLTIPVTLVLPNGEQRYSAKVRKGQTTPLSCLRKLAQKGLVAFDPYTDATAYQIGGNGLLLDSLNGIANSVDNDYYWQLFAAPRHKVVVYRRNRFQLQSMDLLESLTAPYFFSGANDALDRTLLGQTQPFVTLEALELARRSRQQMSKLNHLLRQKASPQKLWVVYEPRNLYLQR